ncbi:MAG: RusA family crossover junction endodeoxyribonuclease [Chloroflexi bacterium]|nr:RusA family crossover junction endodeoxyribonuclease [Chloroflexota bacterium]
MPPAGPLTIVVHGKPKPKGSMRHVGHGRMIEQVAGSKPWREAVKHAALNQAPGVQLAGPLRVWITYTVSRPQHHYGSGRNALLLRDNAPAWPHNRSSGDADKQARNVLDALVDAGLMGDDSQVADLRVVKTYVNQGDDALPTPGAVIRVWPIPPQPRSPQL